MTNDKRRDVEIKIGAALDTSLEPLEFDLDELLAKAMKDDDASPPELIHQLTWARHHGYQARIPATRVFEHIRGKFGANYLASLQSLDDALEEMKRARSHVRDMNVHLDECLNPIMTIVSKNDRQWKHSALWTRVRGRSVEAPKKVDDAIASIIAAKVTAK